jgi:hypothetical protein
MSKKASNEENASPAADEQAPEASAYYTVVRGPIKVGKMILGRGHKNLRLTAAQAAALGDHVRPEMPTV